MLNLGYKLMSEEHGPADLVRNAQHAEQAGFDFAAISDHFSPWLEEQGHAPLAWSVLGAVANATRRIGLMTAVTCPSMRYHPAIIAQGAATVAMLSNNRFTLGLGAGERLNEHVIGAGWPGRGERHERLSEAVDIIQGLLGDTLTNYRGKHLHLDHARLFDRPERKPAVAIAAGGIEAARLAGRKADGLIVTEARPELVEAYAAAGGSGPRYAEVALCYAEREGDARKTAHRYFRGRRVAGDGGTTRHGGVRSGEQTCVARDGEPVGQLRPVAGASSRGDPSLCPRGLRSHHTGPGGTATK
jgi:G6PDH family F420-dependent oxidoreductase